MDWGGVVHVCSRNNIACVPDVGTLGDGTLGDEERPQPTWFCSQFVILQRRSILAAHVRPGLQQQVQRHPPSWHSH